MEHIRIPVSNLEPEKESKALCDMIEKDYVLKGIEEIGEGSACFEHSFEFWWTWRVKKEGIRLFEKFRKLA